MSVRKMCVPLKYRTERSGKRFNQTRESKCSRVGEGVIAGV